jgi:hypothetical protein
MAITYSFIRSISGLSEAELPDTVLEDLDIINMVDLWFSALPPDIIGGMQPYYINYFKGYKAIVLLETYILTAVPERIKDNFNEVSRFDKLEAMIQLAKEKVYALENPSLGKLTYFDIVAPELDPVTQEVR